MFLNKKFRFIIDQNQCEALISIFLLKAGGKPSTWFPPGGLVEQDISILTKSTYQKNFNKKIHMLDSQKMKCINNFHRVPFPNDLDFLQTPNSMQMTWVTLQPICCVSRHLSMLTINIYKQALCTRKIEFIKIKCQAQISFSIMLHN